MWYNAVWIKGIAYLNTFILADKKTGKGKDTDTEIVLDTDPFSYLKDNTVSNNKPLRNTAMSFYKLMMVVGVVGLMASLSVAGYKLALARTGNSTTEAKREILTKMLIGVVIFGSVAILGIVFEIADSLA